MRCWSRSTGCSPCSYPVHPACRRRWSHCPGKASACACRAPPIRLLLAGEQGSVRVRSWDPDDGFQPEATISGSLTALLALLREPGDRGRARFDGRVELLADLQRRFRTLQPDWTLPLSRLLGAERSERWIKEGQRGRDWLRSSAGSIARTGGEYLTEERRWLPSRPEFEALQADVEQTRDDVERLAARVARLQRRAAGPQAS